MTTIIGIEYPDHCVIIADSLVTDDEGVKFTHPVMDKVIQNGSLLIAGAGEVVPCDIAMRIWKPPSLTTKHRKDIYNFRISKVIPSLRKCLSENGYNFDEPEAKKSGMRFHFIIACGGELFDVDEDLSVMKNEGGLYGAGSGSQFALGAVKAGADLHTAMEIAEHFSAFTARPFKEYKQDKFN